MIDQVEHQTQRRTSAAALTTPAAVCRFLQRCLRRVESGAESPEWGEIMLALGQELIEGLWIVEAARCRAQMAAAERSLREIRAVCRERGN